MAKLTQHDKDLRAARLLKGRTQNLLKLTNSAMDTDQVASAMTKEDIADFKAAKAAFENVLKRMPYV